MKPIRHYLVSELVKEIAKRENVLSVTVINREGGKHHVANRVKVNPK